MLEAEVRPPNLRYDGGHAVRAEAAGGNESCIALSLSLSFAELGVSVWANLEKLNKTSDSESAP